MAYRFLLLIPSILANQQLGKTAASRRASSRVMLRRLSGTSGWATMRHGPPPRHVAIDDRPTSLTLDEPEFWQSLREIAYTRRVTLGRLFSVINQHKGKDIPLASALRIFVAQHYREAASRP